MVRCWAVRRVLTLVGIFVQCIELSDGIVEGLERTNERVMQEGETGGWPRAYLFG